MKKLSSILCALMLVSFILPVFSAGGSAASLPAIKGDVNGDGIVTSADAEIVADVCAGTVSAPAASSTQFKAANITGSDLDMEDARRIARAARGVAAYESLYSSTAEAGTALVAYFNAIANSVKSADFKAANKVISFSHNVSRTTGGEVSMSRYNSVTKKYEALDLKTLGTLLGQDIDMSDMMTGVNENTDSYTAPSKVSISNESYPISGSTACSTLSASDIASISVSMWQSTDLLSKLPSKLTSGTKSYDISAYKNKAASLARCMKITVTLKQESDTSIKRLGTAVSSREKLMDTSFRELVNSYPITNMESSDGMTMTMTLGCNSAVSNVTAVYYVDTTTLKPVAAVYNSKVVLDQHMEMTGDLPIVGLFKLSMPTDMINTNDDYFLFSGTFS